MTSALTELETKIRQKEYLLGVIGLGYVGLPLSLTFLRKDIPVLGFDVDPKKISKIEGGISYIKHIPSDDLAGFVQQGKFAATADFSRLNEPDVILMCVPTPLTQNREPDMQFIEKTAQASAAVLRPGQLIILESTTYPGTTVELLQPILETSGLRAGGDFALAYSPEREDPGNTRYSTANIPKVVGGIDDMSTALAAAFYRTGLQSVVEVSSPQTAEMSKLLENIFRSVNIALVNELKILCHRMGIDVWEVIKASSTKPFGFMPFYPGPGLGGHCIPIDPFYLTSKAREYDFPTKFIELAGEVNTAMPYYIVQRVMEALNSRKKSINGSKILLLGMAYKKDVDDPRESPSFKLMELLQEKGAEVHYNDPYIPVLSRMRKYSFNLKSADLTAETISSMDCILLATNHSAYDYQFILDHAKLIVDTRNAFNGLRGKAEKVVPA
ncbi:MAG: nucleotide sugar dehydrogenase [Deltaproteobacteria bacterium]|jgi:UDP-N-acetyl-D-glucosamine dehydrogenase|nr:nucleotide sugar dehydrogenase [Deltaproteobacteria bacterium]